jgi:tetratricopeptide (TPR) repeat protein
VLLAAGVLVCAAAAGAAGTPSSWGRDGPVQADAHPPRNEPPRSGPASPDPLAAPAAPGASDPAAEALREEAFAVVRQLMQDFPEDTAAMGMMGTLHRWLGDSAEAARWWQKCLEQNPREVRAYHGLAVVASMKGDWETALALWRKAQDISPDAAGVRGASAEVLLKMGRAQEAVAALEKEVELSPGVAMYQFLLGQAWFQQKEYEKAARCYQKALEIEPRFSHAYHGLGCTCMKLGQTDKARQYLDRFQGLREQEEQTNTELRRGGTQQDMAIILARTHVNAGDLCAAHRRLKDSERHWQRAAALDPRNRSCRQSLADLYRLSGRFSEALEVCEQLRQIDPGNAPRYYVSIGSLLIRLQRLDDAEEAFRKGLELAPALPPLHRGLVQLLLRRGQKLPEAHTLAQKLVELEPTAPNYSLLAEACHRNGDVAGAREAVRRAMDLEPADGKARKAPVAPPQEK